MKQHLSLEQLLKMLGLLLVIFWFTPIPVLAMSSIYTGLTEKDCPVIQTDKETGATKQICAGVGGFKLELLYDDERVSINVIAPGGKKHELNYWEVISYRFSNHGDKAEWRVEKEGKMLIPKALIVRINIFEDETNPQKATPYLAVSKITAIEACVTDKIPPGTKQNEKARVAADMAILKPCLKPSNGSLINYSPDR